MHRQVHDIMVLAAAIKGEEVVEDPIDLTWAAEPLKVIEWLAKDTGDWGTNRDRCAMDAASCVHACASWKLPGLVHTHSSACYRP